MGWERYLMHRWWSAAELNALEEQLVAQRRNARERSKRVFGRLQHENAHIAWMLRALADLLLEKGVITKAELFAALTRADLEDGVESGELDPELVVPGSKKPSADKASAGEPAAPKPAPEVVARAKAHVESLRKQKKKGSSS